MTELDKVLDNEYQANLQRNAVSLEEIARDEYPEEVRALKAHRLLEAIVGMIDAQIASTVKMNHKWDTVEIARKQLLERIKAVI